MGSKSNIEWTDATWNPWRGCTKISPGCASCYMFTGQLRWGQDPSTIVRASSSTFDAPLKWRQPKMVFTCSWSDFFHEEADAWRSDAWDVIRATPHLTYQILTKRPERIVEHLPVDWGDGWSNVWLGVSVENQRMTWRLDQLVDIPAHIRFVSAEPLLKPVDLFEWLPRIDWLIVGGESGGRPGHPARKMDEEWVRDLRDQCISTAVPFFFKQWGGRFPGGDALLDGRTWREFPVPTPLPVLVTI
ncbi:MAG: phage Gp37/Gp68 family protein [Chloroflexi bacterium]|nr:phage Gp37/Gp68 family protein [Chloroflexota bacterium]MCI0872984.1 phage Gp37/Gp68 family protein [Chloroflexota bacterium]